MFGSRWEQRYPCEGPAAIPAVGAIASAASTIGAFMMSQKGAPAMPAAEEPVAMPTPDDEAQKRARRRSVARSLANRGRASTMLTGEDTLGGGV